MSAYFPFSLAFLYNTNLKWLNRKRKSGYYLQAQGFISQIQRFRPSGGRNNEYRAVFLKAQLLTLDQQYATCYNGQEISGNQYSNLIRAVSANNTIITSSFCLGIIGVNLQGPTGIDKVGHWSELCYSSSLILRPIPLSLSAPRGEREMGKIKRERAS